MHVGSELGTVQPPSSLQVCEPAAAAAAAADAARGEGGWWCWYCQKLRIRDFRVGRVEYNIFLQTHQSSCKPPTASSC